MEERETRCAAAGLAEATLAEPADAGMAPVPLLPNQGRAGPKEGEG